MKYDELLSQVTPELYATFKRSLELGRWPDGREMTAEQREHCLQAVIAYDRMHTPEGQRVGDIDRGRKTAAYERKQPLRWADQGDSRGSEEGDSN